MPEPHPDGATPKDWATEPASQPPDGELVPMVDGGLLVNPAPDPLSKGEGPAVHVHSDLRLREANALGLIFDALVEVRWNDPVDPRLNPYRGAKILLDGWGEFQRGFVKDLQDCARVDPNISGRMLHKSGVFARFAWAAIKARLRAWSVHYLGVSLPPRRIVAMFEKSFQARPVLPDIEESVFEVEEHGAFAGIYDEYFSSGLKRVGTAHEIANDIRNPVQREWAHKQIARDAAKARKAMKS